MAKKKKKPVKPNGGGVGNTGPRKTIGYDLAVSNTTGAYRFDFRTYDATGTTYLLDIRSTSDRAELVKRIIETIARVWPKQELYCNVDEYNKITEVSDLSSAFEG